MQVATIKEFVAQKGYTQVVPKVRSNVNGYPFITLINSKNEAENIYFSKAASADLTVDQDVTKDMFKSYQIAFVKNEAGEERIKIISNSERVDISSLWD